MIQAIQIYRLLFNRFGSQGWWPTTPEGKIQPVYHSVPKTDNLKETEKYEICVGAILTQNTAWSNVEKALIQLNKNRVLSPAKILKTPFQKLAKMVRSSGYFRQKTKKLRKFSEHLVRHYDGKVSPILEKPLPVAREELLSLHGIGPETADSILLYAGGYPIFVVDAYTKRIGQRVGLFRTEKYSEIQRYFESHLKKSASLFNEYHALLVALGKNICRTKPLCDKCPLQRICEYANR